MRTSPSSAGPDLPERPADALELAADLEAAGRHADAIDLLNRVNRRRRNAKVERRLVELRHRAFASLERAPGLPSWPVPIEDRFEGVTGPPEVDAAELTTDLVRSAVTNHGCLVVRRLLEADHIGLLIDDIDRALEAAEAHGKNEATRESLAWWVPFKPDPPHRVGGGRQWIWDQGSVWAVDSPRALFDLVEIFNEIGLAEVIEDYFGETPAISVKKCTLRRVPADTGTNWHQDGAFMGTGIRTLNVWIALSACGDDSPSLDVVPRRLDHIVETGTDGALFDWSVGEGAVERVLGDSAVIRPRFAAGDAMLFDEMFLHRTGVSPGMTRDRYTIESWFFAPSAYPEAQIPVVF
jgi:hypothetical protein